MTRWQIIVRTQTGSQVESQLTLILSGPDILAETVARRLSALMSLTQNGVARVAAKCLTEPDYSFTVTPDGLKEMLVVYTRNGVAKRLVRKMSKGTPRGSFGVPPSRKRNRAVVKRPKVRDGLPNPNEKVASHPTAPEPALTPTPE